MKHFLAVLSVLMAFSVMGQTATTQPDPRFELDRLHREVARLTTENKTLKDEISKRDDAAKNAEIAKVAAREAEAKQKTDAATAVKKASTTDIKKGMALADVQKLLGQRGELKARFDDGSENYSFWGYDRTDPSNPIPMECSINFDHGAVVSCMASPAK